MATWDITVPAGSGVGDGSTADTAITEPGDFDGATISDVAVLSSPTVTTDGATDDTIQVYWYISTDAAVDVYGGASYANSFCRVEFGDSVSAAQTITENGSATPAPTTAVAADWDEVRMRVAYSANMKNDAETVSWSAFTIRVTYTPQADVDITTNAPQALTLTEQVATITHNVDITTNAPQALLVTENQQTIGFDVNITTNAPQALAITANQQTVTHNVDIATGAPQALAITENQQTVTHNVSITTGTPQSLAITTNQATVAYSFNISTNAPQALTLTTQQATLTYNIVITTGSPQALTITEQSATITHNTGGASFSTGPDNRSYRRTPELRLPRL